MSWFIRHVIPGINTHNHRVNAAERAIQTFNNHIVAVLSTCDENFPSVLCYKLIKQAQDTLNMLCTSCTHTQLSSYHVLEGRYDFNQFPFSPPVCQAKQSTHHKLERAGD